MSGRALSKDTAKMGFMNRASKAINPFEVENASTPKSKRAVSNSLLSFPSISDLTTLTSPHTGRNIFGAPEVSAEIEEEVEVEERESKGKKRKSDVVEQIRRPPPPKKPNHVQPSFQKPSGFEDLKPKEKTGGNSRTIVSQRDGEKKRNRRQEASSGGPPSEMMKRKGKGKEVEEEPTWDEQGVERAWDAGKELDSEEMDSEDEVEDNEGSEDESDDSEILNLLMGETLKSKSIKLEEEIDDEIMIQEMDFEADSFKAPVQAKKKRRGRGGGK